VEGISNNFTQILPKLVEGISNNFTQILPKLVEGISNNFTQIKASPGNDKIRMKYRVTSAVFSIKIRFDSVFNQIKESDHNDVKHLERQALV